MVNEGENPAFFTVQEFAKKLHVHPNTVRRAIKNGKILAFTLGAGKKPPYRIPYTEIERLMISHFEEVAEAIMLKRASHK